MGWFSDLFKKLGGILGNIFHFISSLLSDVLRVIYNTIRLIIEFIGEHFVEIVIVAIIAIAIITMPQVIGLIAHITAADSIIFATYIDVLTFAIHIQVSFAAFLTAIHFTTLLAIHNIAYILSAEYRVMMNKMFRQLRFLSTNLSLGTDTIMLLLENTRSVAASASAIMGRNYDLFQISWLKQFHGIFKKMSGRLDLYRHNPGSLITDLDEWIAKPTLDVAAHTQLFIFKTISQLTKGIEETVGLVSDLFNDVEKLVKDLPEFIRVEIKPGFDKLNKQFEDFLYESYDPAIKTLTGVTKALDSHRKKAEKDIDGISERLKYPGDLFITIDDLTDEERLEQETLIAEVVSRRYDKSTDEFSDESKETHEKLSKIRDALDMELPPPPWESGEAVFPLKVAGVKAAFRKTWFVGDY
jgi:hypothetical protein